MKRFIIAISAISTILATASAQETAVAESAAKYKLYGFIRNFAVFDSREAYAGTDDLYFYMPKDESGDPDANAIASFRMLSLTTRLGLDVSGYRYGDMNLSGKVEADFYCKSGSVAVLRLRQAYVALNWKGLGKKGDDALTVNIGQTWHPMAADMPHIVNLETGAPFNPFNRSPQVMANYSFGGKIDITGGFLYNMQYLPVGPTSYANTVTTKSANFMKYGLLPELYLGFSFRPARNFLARVGSNFLSIKPLWKDGNGNKLGGRLTAMSPFVFMQYTGKNGFQIKAKSVLAQSGEHMNLLSGYGASRLNSDGGYDYTPMRSSVSFISAQYGRKWQVLGMLGYVKLLGTAEDLIDTNKLYWFNTSVLDADNFRQMYRFTPTIAYNMGKLTFALEYNLTSVQFGENKGADGVVTDNLHWVTNHRILAMVKFNL